MPEKLNSRDFSEQLHTAFQVHMPGAAPLTLELFEVTEKDSSPNVEQFSLIFRGPLEPYFPQGTYTLQHDKLGEFALFLVPLGPDAAGMSYQAIFNRFRHPSRHSA